MREPDKIGNVGKAWIVGRKKTKAHEATLLDYIINCPEIYPFWWAMSLIHLRDIDGVSPANKQYPEAEYELIVLEKNPEAPPPKPDDLVFYWLFPPNICKQFHGVTDEDAKGICSDVVEHIINGSISPDNKKAWQTFIENKLNILKEKGVNDGRNY